jgi:hypothetical protein
MKVEDNVAKPFGSTTSTHYPNSADLQTARPTGSQIGLALNVEQERYADELAGE